MVPPGSSIRLCCGVLRSMLKPTADRCRKALGLPEDLAAAIAFLASEEGSYVTGQVISTNGGRYMGSH